MNAASPYDGIGRNRDGPAPCHPDPQPRTPDPLPVDADTQTQPFDAVRTHILDRRAIFARQGSVVATWRMRAGRRCGPYYRLAYREAGRQQSLHLGASAPLAEQVRALLAELHQPLRYGRLLDRLAAEARASLRQANAELNRVLGSIGYYLKGHHEFRRLSGSRATASSARLRMVDAWVHRSLLCQAADSRRREGG
ncbi:MAG: hypothetical protein ACYC35_13905 [Pirellulales bacterium]